MVKVYKNSYVSFCYRIFGSTTEMILKCAEMILCIQSKCFYWDCTDLQVLLPSYKVSVLYWDKVGSSEKNLLILEVVFGEGSHLVQST